MSRTFSRGSPRIRAKRLAVAVRGLGRRPDRRAVGADVRHAARRAERSVGLDRPPVSRAEGLDAGAGRPERRQVALLRHVLVPDDLRRADRVGEREVVGQPRARRPLGPERARGAHRVPLPLGDDAEEAADPHDPRAGNRGDRRLVDRLEGRAERRRADRAAVEHAGEREVLDVEVAAGDLRRHVRTRDGLADVTEGARRLERRLGVDREPELAVTDQLAVGHARAAALRADDAVGDRRGLRPGCPSRWAASASSASRAVAAARRSSWPPRVMPVLPPVPPWSGHTAVSPSISSVIRSMVTSSSSATICRIAARPPVPRSTLPVNTRDGAIGVDGEEGVDLVRGDGLAEVAIGRPAGSRGGGLRRRPARRPGAQAEPDDQRATGAEKRATRDGGHPRLLPSSGRRASPPGSPARDCRSGRGCRRAPASPRTPSGRRFCWRNARAVITRPAVQ